MGAEVLVQQAAVFFCTITCSIIVLWITSIAGDNRQAAKRSGWHRTPASRWETVWIISRLPADCLQEVGALMCGQGSGEFQWAVSVLSLARCVELTAHPRWLLGVTAADLIASLQPGLNVYWSSTHKCTLLTGRTAIVWASVGSALCWGRIEHRSVAFLNATQYQDSLSMRESWRKVIPGLRMIKVTPHGVSQIRFFSFVCPCVCVRVCVFDTMATAYSMLSCIPSVSPVRLTSLRCNYSEWQREDAWVQEEVEGNVIPLSSVLLLPVVQRIININPGSKLNYFNGDQSNLKTCIYSPRNLIISHTHGGPSKSFHLSKLRGLKEQLPAHLLQRSELPESILVFAVAHRSEVLGLQHIYYLHNCYAARIYFSCFPPMSRTFCRGTCFLSTELNFDADATLTQDVQTIEWLLETVKRLHKDELCLWPSLSATHGD